MLSFDEIWMEWELAKFPIIPDSEQEEASARLVEAENHLPSLTTEPEREPESESEREISINNFAIKARHRKHFHACMEEGKYHNGSRGNKPEKTYSLYNKAEARRREKETFKTEIPFYLAEAEQEFADEKRAKWWEEWYKKHHPSEQNEKNFRSANEYTLKVLKAFGIIKGSEGKIFVEGLGEITFDDLDRYYSQI